MSNETRHNIVATVNHTVIAPNPNTSGRTKRRITWMDIEGGGTTYGVLPPGTEVNPGDKVEFKADINRFGLFENITLFFNHSLHQ